MRKNIEHIIEIAANNLYRIEIQYNIANFFHILISKVPTLKGLKHLNFPRLPSRDENKDKDRNKSSIYYFLKFLL